tara:strand:- start:370 stop:585 length:216 start_codon:yes stop_codon:yes gene_type:complete
MTHATSSAEIRLHRAMIDNNLTIDEAIIAMELFRDNLNTESLEVHNEGVDNRVKIYDNDFTILDDWDRWTD